MPKTERSAGVIVFRRFPDDTRFLLLNSGKYWDFAKGHLEKGETDTHAALRELTEETGINDAELIPGFAHEIRYFFRLKSALVSKSVIYFLAETKKEKIRLSDEHVGWEFLSYEEARKRLSHANSRALLKLAKDCLTDTPIPPKRTK